jgi:DNA replication protein DnaC
MTTTQQAGRCECGNPVIREIPDDWIGAVMSRVPFVCDPCIDRLDAQEHADAEAFRRDQQIRRCQALLRQSGLPAKHADLTLDALSLGETAVAEARAWADAPSGRGLLLHGPVGVGKTHLAAAATGSLIAQGVKTHWLSGPELFARLGTGLGTDTHDEILAVLTSRDALVLDDIDKTRPTPYGAENVFLAVDGRVSNLVPLLVTTNLKLSELAQYWPEPYGEAIASRLGGYCRIVHMTGTDRRITA